MVQLLFLHYIESMKTTSMETVITRGLGKNKERYFRSKYKAKKYAKIQQNDDLQSIMLNLQSNCCLKVMLTFHVQMYSGPGM